MKPTDTLPRRLAILAIALLAPFSLIAQELELIPSGPLEVDTETGEFVATEGARITFGDWILSADTIRYNQQTEEAEATGNVVFTGEDIRLTAASLVYRPKLSFARATDFRVGNGTVYLDGSLLEGNPDTFRFNDVNFYPGEPGTFLFEARAGELALIDRNEIRGKRLFFKVGFVPFLLIPNITQPLDAETNLFEPQLDYSGNIGALIGAEALAPVSDDLRLGGNIALTSKRGILLGPAARFSRNDEDTQATGSFLSGYINDQGDLGTDLRGEQIPSDRYFANLRHQQFWHDNTVNLTTQFNYWSDSEVTRDFNEDSFDRMQVPDSYLEANYNQTRWTASLFARSRLNNFESYAERLPELRFTYLPEYLGNGFSHSGGASFAKRKSETRSFRYTGDEIDAFYNLRYWRPLRDGIDFGLKATLRHLDSDSTTRFLTVEPNDITLDESLTFGEFGADLAIKAVSYFDLKNETWDIFGLRHIIEPTLSYRYTPQLNGEKGPRAFFLLPVRPEGELDAAVFSTLLPPIDLEERVDTFSITEEHKLRFALKNRIQAKSKSEAVRTLARFDVAIDLFKDRQNGPIAILPNGAAVRRAPRDYSDLHLDLSLTPAPWVAIDFSSQLDPNDSFSESSLASRITFQDRGYWKVGFGSQFVRGLPADRLSLITGREVTPRDFPGLIRLEQYYAFAEYQFSENLKIYATSRYDDATGTFYEQRIGLMQRALERYGLKYELRIYDGDRREQDFGISLGIDLFDE